LKIENQGRFLMDNAVRDKSKKFAVRIIRMCRHLEKEKHGLVLINQVMRSGTSIGANVCEALQGQSRADFTARMSIALKEAFETKYWLELLFETEYISKDEFTSIENDCEELLKMLTSIVKTSKQNRT